MTDEAGQYTHLNKDFASHEYVNHGAGEYTLEGYYSIFKRGMKGIIAMQMLLRAMLIGRGIRFPLQQSREAWLR